MPRPRFIPPVYVYDLPEAGPVNAALLQAYARESEAPDVTRSHFFEGRYENIYIPRERLPEIDIILDAACRITAEIRQRPMEELQAGFWFNDMPPGSVTLSHTHDDDDELLSCVYYVDTPTNSGCLVVEEFGQRMLIVPRAGRFVLFAPDVPHRVTRNLSSQPRLSIGINIGAVKDGA